MTWGGESKVEFLRGVPYKYPVLDPIRKSSYSKGIGVCVPKKCILVKDTITGPERVKAFKPSESARAGSWVSGLSESKCCARVGGPRYTCEGIMALRRGFYWSSGLSVSPKAHHSSFNDD